MKKIRILVRKEILDILRDKKTLVMMVVVPVLLYPLLIIGMTLVMGMMMQSEEEQIHTIVFAEAQGEPAERLKELYEEHQEELGVRLVFADDADTVGDVCLEIEEKGTDQYHVKVLYDSADSDSRTTCQAAEELLELYREELLLQNLEHQGLEEEFLYPVSYESQDSATLSESVSMDIGGSIGLMLITTILLGAIYPAIDATAGEKERGTLETLLTLPVTNFQMIMSKYLSVSLFACVTAVISLLSLGGSVLFLIFGLSEDLLGEFQGLSAAAVLPVIPVLLLTLISTALLATALCMCFCVFARSFKEANNYITPVLLVVMFASMAGMVPSVKLDSKTALIPIVNVSLLIKQIIAGQFEFGPAGITIVVNMACSVLIVWILAKIYDSENVLFSDGFVRFRMFQNRKDIRRGTIPDYGDLVLSITVLLLLILYVGNVAAVQLGFWGTAVSQLLILAVPLFAAWYLKADMRRLFSLNVPKVNAIAGSLFLYIGTYCLMMALSGIMTEILPGSTQNVEEAFSAMTEQPPAILLLVTAVMPAVGEELLFRGFLFGSLKARCGWKKGILISAVVFGLFHMSLVKLIPTAMLGAAFAYIVHVSGSLYVSSVLHFVNNAVSILVLKYPDQAMHLVPVLAKEQMTGLDILMFAGIGTVFALAGFLLLRRTDKAHSVGTAKG